jgi:uncharacterized protein YacL
VVKSETWTRWVGTGLGVVGGFILGVALVNTSGIHRGGWVIIALTSLEGFIFAYLGTPYMLGGWRRFDFRLKTTPLPDLIAGLLGLIVGLIVAALIGFFVRAFPYGGVLSTVLAALLAFMGASIGMTRRSELVALVAGAQPPAKEHRISSALLDTSVIIDGRILDLVRTGFIDMPLVVPRSVLQELQYVADASDAMRRHRGRRGLEVLEQMQKEPRLSLEFHDDTSPGPVEADGQLIRLARQNGWAIMTNDFNLNRVARLEGITVLNLNDLANALKPIAIPGEELTVSVVREGKEPGQGVAYLDDGTMVVVENGRRHLGENVTATVTSVLQTAAGRMIFAQLGGPANGRRRRVEGKGKEH